MQCSVHLYVAEGSRELSFSTSPDDGVWPWLLGTIWNGRSSHAALHKGQTTGSLELTLGWQREWELLLFLAWKSTSLQTHICSKMNVKPLNMITHIDIVKTTHSFSLTWEFFLGKNSDKRQKQILKIRTSYRYLRCKLQRKLKLYDDFISHHVSLHLKTCGEPKCRRLGYVDKSPT